LSLLCLLEQRGGAWRPQQLAADTRRSPGFSIGDLLGPKECVSVLQTLTEPALAVDDRGKWCPPARGRTDAGTNHVVEMTLGGSGILDLEEELSLDNR
jgi:hypothetical protein